MYIVIAGGGIVGGQLARRLLENKHDVVLIDPRKEVCDKLYAETGVVAVNGSNTNIDILKEAGEIGRVRGVMAESDAGDKFSVAADVQKLHGVQESDDGGDTDVDKLASQRPKL